MYPNVIEGIKDKLEINKCRNYTFVYKGYLITIKDNIALIENKDNYWVSII